MKNNENNITLNNNINSSEELGRKNEDFSESAAAPYSSEIVMEASTGRVMSGSNIHARLPMASTTKAMTALVVIENRKLDEVVTIPQEAVGIEGSSIYLTKGEKLTVKELLYGLMMRSGNDAAVALAIHTGGSVKGFCDMMNKKALDLGLKNSNFTNPHGLHDKNHFTSAYDLAFISSVAMQNASFKEICSTKNIKISGDNEENIRYFHNKNKILNTYPGGNGVKTGFTKAAGRCLIASSFRNNMQVVAVTLNCPDMFPRCEKLMDYAHENYRMVKLHDKSTPVSDISVLGSNVMNTKAYVQKDIYYPLKADEVDKISYQFDVTKELKAPVKSDYECGNMKILLDNHLLFNEKIYTIENIREKTFLEKFKAFFK